MAYDIAKVLLTYINSVMLWEVDLDFIDEKTRVREATKSPQLKHDSVKS